LTVVEAGVLARDLARQQLMTALDHHDVGPDSMAQVASELLHATKVKVQWDPKAREFQISEPLADNVTRHNTLKLLMDFYDTMPSKRVDIEDNRQTKAIANRLIDAITQSGMMGIEDRQREIHSPAPGEIALMGEMVKRKREREMEVMDGEVESRPLSPAPASLSPLDMEDDE